MRVGRSIFGKAIGVSASLMGASVSQVAVPSAKAPGVAAQKVGGEAAVEAELRNLRLVVRDAGYAAHRNRMLTKRGTRTTTPSFSSPMPKN